MEVAKHAKHIRMPQVHLDLNLAPELQVHLVLHELFLVYTLERYHIALVARPRRRDGLRPRKIHAPKFALAERAPDFKLRQAPGPRRLMLQPVHG